ncbi:MAG: type II secretion system F family protein [Verrucomicrobia bacterium]|nr:type II secretion system F family protein [Verrucomicrobiota bacterium]
MSHFEYTFITPEGKKKRGHMSAPNAQEAKSALRTSGVLVTSFKAAKARKSDQLPKEALIDFTLSLASLLKAGLPLFESLKLLTDQAQGTKAHATLEALCNAIKEGVAPSLAFEGHFDPLYCSLVRAGEVSGTLPKTLEKLAQLLKKEQQLKQKLIASLLYPAIVAAFCLGVIVLLLTVALPAMSSLFEGKALSPFTAGVLKASELLRSTWWLLPLLPLFLYRFRKKLLPVTRKEAALARFCYTLATLQEGGVVLIDALKFARSSCNCLDLEQAVERAEASLILGIPLSAHFKKEKAIPTLLPRMFAVAEESGAFAPTLYQLAELYDQATEKRMSRLATLAQPLTLLILGAIVGTIMLAVLLPLTDLSNLL